MIVVDELTVRFGGVIPIDRMTLTLPSGTCGLIGPNCAGKTTFFNVLSGFVRPIAGTVRAFDTDLLAMADFRRARWGVRRTFQMEQAIADLTVYDNVLLVHEQTSGPRASGARTCSTRRPSLASKPTPTAASAHSVRPNGAWSRSLGRSSASLGSYCSTNRPLACPRRRPPTSPA